MPLPLARSIHLTKTSSHPLFGLFSDSDKKISNSWGGATNELANESLAQADAAADAAAPVEGDAGAWGTPEANADDWAAPAGETPAAGAAPTEGREPRERRPRQEDEEPDNTLTLDEYLAKKTDSGLAGLVPKLDAGRKTNDEGSTEIWKDAIKLTKDGEGEAYFAGKVGLFTS